MSISTRSTAALWALALLGVAGCQSGPAAPPDVYVAGYVFDGGGLFDAGVQYATVWKNGVAQRLGDASGNSIATAVALRGDDVLAVGCGPLGPTLWTNGVAEALGTSTADGCAEDVAVSGGDVYVAGWEGVHAMLWKNGVGEPLAGDGSRDARAVTLAGPDVYVAGWGMETTLLPGNVSFSTQVAKLWKNGAPTTLSDGLSPAIADGVAVDGADVYVVGFEIVGADAGAPGGYNVAAVWKNGAVQYLTDFTAKAADVAAAGGDVCVVGAVATQRSGAAAVWRGGARQDLTDGAAPAFAEAVAVSRSGTYVAGHEGDHPMLWKDGAPVHWAAAAPEVPDAGGGIAPPAGRSDPGPAWLSYLSGDALDVLVVER